MIRVSHLADNVSIAAFAPGAVAFYWIPSLTEVSTGMGILVSAMTFVWFGIQSYTRWVEFKERKNREK